MPKDMQMALLFDFYGELLTEKQRDVMIMYYENDLSLSEIAENDGITRQGVRDSLKRAEAQLRDMEERLGLIARFKDLRDGLQRIAAAAALIGEYNERSRLGFSPDIRDAARNIGTWAAGLAEI